MSECEWEVLDVGGDDETRQSATGAVSFTSLYEVVKLAYLQPANPSSFSKEKLPHVVSSAAYGMVCVALEKTILLFAENCSTLVLQLPLPHTIDTVMWLGGPELLVATDRCGALHLIHVPSHRLLITRQLPVSAPGDASKPVVLSAHCQQLTDGACALLFLTACGHLIRVGSMVVEHILDGLARGCVAELRDAELQLTVTSWHLFGTPVLCTTSAVGCSDTHLLVYAACSDGAVRYCAPFPPQNITEEGEEEVVVAEVLVQLPCVCTKLLLVSAGPPLLYGVEPVRYLLGVTKEGSLVLVCTMTGLYRTCCPPAPAAGRVVDAVVLPRTDYTKDPQLLLLLEDTSSSDSWILRIVTLPGLESEYELPVGGGSALVPLAGGVEAMVFLEPDTDARAIKIKTIIDGVPEARLRKLISKQKFDEALKFARLFKLDVSLVAKGKAFFLLQQLMPYRPLSANSTAFMDTSYDSLLDELLGVLDGIQDVGFVGRACVGAMLPTVALTDALLAYAARRLATSAAQEEAALREQVGRLQQRMGTFLQLQPADADVAVWAAFSAADPLQLCTEHLAAGELSMWGCIWRRHQHEFMDRVDEGDVSAMLHGVPGGLPSDALVAWLPHALADLLLICPPALPAILRWTLARIRSLESREKAQWPDNALRVGHAVLGAVGRALSGGSVCAGAALQELRVMLQALQQLHTLLHTYRLRVPLQQYMQSDVASVCSAVLQWLVCGEEVQPLVTQFLRPVLCSGDSAASDAVLQHYVQQQLGELPQQQWLLGEQHEALWEDKLHAVCRAINNLQTRVSCMAACVAHACVPWSAGTEQLCVEALQAAEQDGGAAGQRYSLQLLEHRRLATLKVTLGRHGLRITELSGPSTAQVVLRRLARSKQEGVMEAMLQVVSTFHHLQPSEAYVYRIYHLLQEADVEAARRTLQAVPSLHEQDTCGRLLQLCIQTLRYSHASQQTRRTRERVAEGVVSLQQLLLQRAPPALLQEWRQHLHYIAAISKLQLQYGEHVTWQSLQCPDTCKRLLLQRVSCWFAAADEPVEQPVPDVGDSHGTQQVLRDITEQSSNLGPTSHNNRVSISGSGRQEERKTWLGMNKENAQREPRLSLSQHGTDNASTGTEGAFTGTDGAVTGTTNAFTGTAGSFYGTKGPFTGTKGPFTGTEGPFTGTDMTPAGPEGIIAGTKVSDENQLKEEEEDKKRWQEVSGLLELGGLLGLTRVSVLQMFAEVALQQTRVAPALWAFKLLTQDPLVCKSDAVDLPALVCKLLQLLQLQLQAEVAQESPAEEVDCFTATPALSPHTSDHTTTVALLHHTLRVVHAALLHAQPEWLQWLCTVAGWCSAGAVLYGSCHQQEVFSVADDARADTRARFSAQYCDKGMPLVAHKVALAVMSAVNFCLACYSNRTYAPSSLFAPSDLAPLVKTISEVTSHALQRNNNLTALFLNTKLFSLLKLNSIVDNVESQVPTNDGNVTNNLPQVRQIVDASLIFSLLLKLVQPKNTDIQLGVSLLTLLSLKESLSILNELIKRLGFDYPRLEMVAEIGKSLCEIYSQVEMRARFEDMHKNARWGERFAEMNISFADYFGKHVAIFQNIFNVIVEHPNCSCSLLKDLCTDFNLSYTEAMLCFIRSLVSRGLPAPEDDLTTTSSGWPAEQISQVTAGVEDKVLLREAFVKELSSVNSYHYDAIQFLLKQLAVLDQKESSEQDWHRGLEILQFLRTYERKSKPPSEELDEWNSKNPNSKSFPTIASKRLPFTELFEGSAKLVMKIIDGELDVLTIESWLRCSDSLKLNQDQMCFVAVKNTVSRALVKKQYESNEPWQLTSCHSDLLKDVSVVISRIQHDKLAMACGQSVVKMLPHGADRVLCTHSCLLMARRWRDHSDTTEARDAVAKFTSEYQRLCAEQALHRHSLAQPEHVELVSDVVALVTRLYDHPSLASFSGTNTEDMPRVNECVAELCDAVGAKQSLLQKKLLDKWLLPPDAGLGSCSDDVTVTNFLPLMPGAQAHESDDASLARAMYLVRGCCPDTIIPYLLEQTECTEQRYSAAYRLRALQCLVALTDCPQLHSYVAPDTLQRHLDELTQAVRLEGLGIVCGAELGPQDVQALTEQLWRDHRHSPAALLLMADVCLRYKELKASLWNAVLLQLAACLEAGAVEEAAVRSLLLRLRLHPQLWLVQGFTAAWTAIVSRPFKTLTAPVSAAGMRRCVDAASLLSLCPVTLPSTPALVPLLPPLNLHALAITLAAAHPNTRSLMQELLDAAPQEALKEQLQALAAHAPLPRLVQKLLDANGITLTSGDAA